MKAELISMRNLCGALALSLLPALGVASEATISWDLTSANTNVVINGSSATFSGDYYETLTVEAFALKQGSNPSWAGADIHQYSGGLGVTSAWLDQHTLDNLLQYELLRFDLRNLSHGSEGSFTLSFGSSSDNYYIWGNPDGHLPYHDLNLNLNEGDVNRDVVLGQGTLSSSESTVGFTSDQWFNYLFIGGDLEIFKLRQWHESDSFKVATLTILPEPGPNPVPLPAVWPLFSAALGLFGFVGMRRASKGVASAA